jgi:hypothetical protein
MLNSVFVDIYNYTSQGPLTIAQTSFRAMYIIGLELLYILFILLNPLTLSS